MKKSIILFTGILILTSSCNKRYDCYCKSSSGPDIFTREVKAINKKTADKVCNPDDAYAPSCYAK